MNVYELVTSKIIERLEEGVIPWRKTWTSAPAKSLTTGKEYRGINSLLLGMREYTSRFWLTYKQATKMGGHVKKGEKATPVVYWHWRTPEEMAELEASGKTAAAAPCYPFLSFVFNLDQCEGILRPADDVPMKAQPRIDQAERVVAEMPKRPTIKYGAALNPAYNPAFDVVEMPNREQFEDVQAFFSVLFHELTHGTGHKSRLDRFVKHEGSREERYSYEELVAELGAAFLCGTCGLDSSGQLDNTSAYVSGWLKALRNDKKMLLQAAGAAQKAADFILGQAHERGQEERAAA